MSVNDDDFTSYIQKLRDSRGWGVNKASLMSGVSSAEISRIENGIRKRPHPDILKPLAVAYGVPVINFYLRLGYLDDLSIALIEQPEHPILARIKSHAQSLGVSYEEALKYADVSAEDINDLDTQKPDPRILWPVAQVLGTSMAYLAGLTDRSKPILGVGQALHDQSRLHRPGDDIHPEDAWDLEQAYLRVRKRQAVRKAKERNH